MERKNADYSGYSNHPYANFTAVARLGVDPVHGFLTRMMDKICRIRTLAQQEAKVTDESLKDTISDLANYAMLLAGYLKHVDTREKLLQHAKDFFTECEVETDIVTASFEYLLEKRMLVRLAHKCRQLAESL